MGSLPPEFPKQTNSPYCTARTVFTRPRTRTNQPSSPSSGTRRSSPLRRLLLACYPLRASSRAVASRTPAPLSACYPCSDAGSHHQAHLAAYQITSRVVFLSAGFPSSETCFDCITSNLYRIHPIRVCMCVRGKYRHRLFSYNFAPDKRERERVSSHRDSNSRGSPFLPHLGLDKGGLQLLPPNPFPRTQPTYFRAQYNSSAGSYK